MDRTGIRYFNSYYVESTEAVFKIIELIFGAGAWGPVILVPVNTFSQFSFFLWASFSSWILVLLSYLIGLCKLSTKPTNAEEWKEYYSPRLGDLYMNACIAILLYLPCTVVYCAYAIPQINEFNNGAIFVIVMALATFLVHSIHASTLVLYFMEREKKWQRTKRWWWQKAGRVNKSTKRDGEDNPPTRYETPLPMSPADVQVRQDNEIYQDLS